MRKRSCDKAGRNLCLRDASRKHQDQMATRLLVFYDRACPLCAAEMDTLKAADHDGLLELCDCSVADFQHPAATAAGITQTQLMNSMHVLEQNGRWHHGVAAFAEIYRGLGITSIARHLQHPWLRPVLNRIYPFVARHRQAFSRLGLERLFARYIERQIRLAEANRCSAGSCDLGGQASNSNGQR